MAFDSPLSTHGSLEFVVAWERDMPAGGKNPTKSRKGKRTKRMMATTQRLLPLLLI